jgi:ribosomal protein S18 acetylase RimI-like enzyme
MSGHDAPSPPRFALRNGQPSDIDRLLALEETAFAGDRLSRRSFRNLLRAGSAALVVAEAQPRAWRDGEGASQLDFGFQRIEPSEERTILGYALVLFRERAKSARLYSIAVADGAKGKGVARALLSAAEDAARARGASTLRLEVRADNQPALKLYERQGYRPFDRLEGYYEDGEAAVRLERSLVAPPAPPERGVPYYAQTTDFTCGPAALMMTLSALGDPSPLDRERELALWREATSIYLISAPGGCEPYGLAVTAARRGFRPSIHVSEEGPYFVEARKGEKRRDIMTEAQRIFRAEARRRSIPVSLKPLSTPDLRAAVERGAIAIVLISCHRLHGDKIPHWIVAYAADAHHIFAHDPWLDRESRKPKPGQALAIPVPEFERMAAWGRSRLKAAIVVDRPLD